MHSTSCGILVCNAGAELLLCHASGTQRWDIPKGKIEDDESTAQAALRETAEETGLVFQEDDLLALGRFAYRPSKDLCLYAVLTERFNATACHCRSLFADRFGRMRPEMDAFEWTAFAAVAQRCAPSMGRLLTLALSLPETLAQLEKRDRMAWAS